MDHTRFTPVCTQVRERIHAALGRDIDLPASVSAAAVTAGDDLAHFIDHTLLKPDVTRADILRVCREAKELRFASVCVNPYWTQLVASELAGTSVRVCTVVGFPLGATLTEAKMAETAAAIRLGAQEIDMVLNIGALRGGDDQQVLDDIRAVVEAAHGGGAIVKVILETALLDDVQKGVACVLALLAGADFVKTSTGFGPAGATAHNVALMRAIVGSKMGVKAAGGIRTAADVREMIAAGANRIGASAGVAIIRESTAGQVASAAGPTQSGY